MATISFIGGSKQKNASQFSDDLFNLIVVMWYGHHGRAGSRHNVFVCLSLDTCFLWKKHIITAIHVKPSRHRSFVKNGSAKNGLKRLRSIHGDTLGFCFGKKTLEICQWLDWRLYHILDVRISEWVYNSVYPELLNTWLQRVHLSHRLWIKRATVSCVA